MRTYATGVLLTLIFAFVPGALLADSMRCGQKVISTGDTPAMLEKYCGSPQYKDRGKESVSLDDGWRTVQVERWYYKRSSRSLEQIIIIYRGKVIAMETGGR